MTRRTLAAAAVWCAAVLLVAGCQAGPAGSPPVGTPSSAPTDNAPDSAPGGAPGDALDVLVEQLTAIHPEPFHGIPEAEFTAHLEDLRGRLDGLSADQTTVEVMRLVALLSRAGRDGHQFVLPQAGHDGEVLPLTVYEFTEGVFVTAAPPPYTDLVGARILAIDGRPIAEVLALVEPLVPRDGPATVPAFRPTLLVRCDVLRGLGVIGDGAVSLEVRDAAGDRVAEVEPTAFDAFLAWAGPQGPLGLPDEEDPRYLSRPEEILWSDGPDAAGVLYVRYPAVRRAAPEAYADVQRRLATPGLTRVVLDLRQNSGGDNTRNPALIDVLADTPAGVPLVVLTDRVTFSAAANLATDLEQRFAPVFVGEPMGGGLNFWNDVTWIELDDLPTPLRVGISTRYWQRSTPEDPRLSIEPDIAVPVLAADHFTGRDPTLTAALGPLPTG